MLVLLVLLLLLVLVLRLLLAVRVAGTGGRFPEIMEQFSSAQSGEDFKTINPYKTLLELLELEIFLNNQTHPLPLLSRDQGAERRYLCCLGREREKETEL